MSKGKKSESIIVGNNFKVKMGKRKRERKREREIKEIKEITRMRDYQRWRTNKKKK